MAPAKSRSSSGFSIVEVLIAMGLLTIVSLGVAQLFAVSTRANLMAKGQTSTTAMAEQKMEQLRGLTWGYDTAGQGLPLSDTSTNLAIDPPNSSGSGLNPSPSGTLDANTTGYVDFLDANGTYVGTGSTPPTSAAYIRRWAVQPLPTNPNNTLILQVLVTPVANEASITTPQSPRKRMPGDAMLTSVRTRKAQ
jgi:type II secretory pathway pseudopilin PulG